MAMSSRVNSRTRYVAIRVLLLVCGPVGGLLLGGPTAPDSLRT